MLIPAKIFIACSITLSYVCPIQYNKFTIPIEYVIPTTENNWTYPKANNQIITKEDFIKDYEDYLYKPEQ